MTTLAQFLVINGRNVLKMALFFALLAGALWYVFQAGPSSEVGMMRSDISFWRQFVPRPQTATYAEKEAFEVLAVLDADLIQDDQSELVAVKPAPTRFSEYRIERERARSQQLELLENVLYDHTVSEERKAEAQQRLVSMLSTMTRETELENLLKAKGYLDAVIIIDQNAVTLVVPTPLSQEEAVRIGELVNRLTGVRLDRITIIDEVSRG